MKIDYLPNIGPGLQTMGFECSIVAGGSYSYKDPKEFTFSDLRDIDLLIFMRDKSAITTLFTDHQQKLVNILQIITPEKVLDSEDLSPFENGVADAIRFSGINNYGQKISAKFISYNQFDQILNQNGSGRINVLSKKDKRFYDKKSFNGKSFYLGVVNQKTNTDLTILGDPDIIELKNTCTIGVISDVLLSGKVIYQSERLDALTLKNQLVKKILKIADRKSIKVNWKDILIRSDRFSENFSKEYTNNVSGVVGEQTTNQDNQKVPEFGLNIVTPVINKIGKKVNYEIRNKLNISELQYNQTSGPFSSNSKYGKAQLKNNGEVFFKEMLNDYRFEGELSGQKVVSSYFSHIQNPIFIQNESKRVFYEWNDGDILANKRLKSIDTEAIKYFLEVELRKSEDHLNAYLFSVRDFLNKKVDETLLNNSRIHDLYYKRLVGDRLQLFYENFELNINGKIYKFINLFDYDLIVNNKNYGKLSGIIKNFSTLLNPANFVNRIKICGLGDSHSGNVIVEDSPDDYLYIDYEFSGFHSPYLDIAKEIYNDCAFNVFYSDKLPDFSYNLDIEIQNNSLIINHDYLPDKLSRLLLKTKIEGTILPLREYLKSINRDTDEDWDQILGGALFCSGFLTRKPTDFVKADAFLLNFANCIEMSSFNTYCDRVFSTNLVD